MWNLLRTVLLVFVLVGFFGQSTAHAMPVQVFHSAEVAAETMDCAEAMDRAADKSGGPADCCKDMTPDCVAKMGCAAVGAPLPPLVLIPPRVATRPIDFTHLNITREGAGPAPLFSPPQQLA